MNIDESSGIFSNLQRLSNNVSLHWVILFYFSWFIGLFAIMLGRAKKTGIGTFIKVHCSIFYPIRPLFFKYETRTFLNLLVKNCTWLIVHYYYPYKHLFFLFYNKFETIKKIKIVFSKVDHLHNELKHVRVVAHNAF